MFYVYVYCKFTQTHTYTHNITKAVLANQIKSHLVLHKVRFKELVPKYKIPQIKRIITFIHNTHEYKTFSHQKTG